MILEKMLSPSAISEVYSTTPMMHCEFQGGSRGGVGGGVFRRGGEVFGKVSFSFNKISAGKKKKGLRKLRQNV